MNFAIFVQNLISMRLIIVVALFFSFSSSSAQDTIKHYARQVKQASILLDSSAQAVTIDSANSVFGLVEKKSEKIDLLIEDYLENKKYNGYRVQLFSSANRLEAVKAKSKFLKNFADIKSYLVYQAPNYKVRVGDFLDRLEANQQLKVIQEIFPNAFLVKGEIEPKTK